jgi:hypothetical protein
VTQYPPKIGPERFTAALSGYARRIAILETRTSGIDSGFPLMLLPGVVDPGYVAGDPMVHVNGAAALTGPYQHLASYTPAAGDSVLLAPVGALKTYVVLGKLA